MLSWTCHDMHATISACAESFPETVRRRLREKFTEAQTDHLLNLARKYSFVISGSFILACIYEESWYNDIDIYENVERTYSLLGDDTVSVIKSVTVKTDHMGYVPAEIEKMRSNLLRIHQGDTTISWNPQMSVETYLRDLAHFTPTSKFLYKQVLEDMNYCKNHWTRISLVDQLCSQIRSFRFGSTRQPIQHIAIHKDPMSIIARSFDADILKNTYDGRNLQVWDWKLLIKREDFVKPTGKLFMDYMVPGTAPPDITLDELRNDSYKRIEKYAQRDIKLTLHPDYDIIHAEIDKEFWGSRNVVS